MKCLYFYDSMQTNAVEDYNAWAKGKQLAKDVIIHTHQISDAVAEARYTTIIVFFDEVQHPTW